MKISAIPMPCWGHFHVIVRPQFFAWKLWLVDRPLQAWWHLALQLVSEHVGAVSCWIPRLIFKEHMMQSTGFVSIGCGPGLVSTSPERSNNFEVSQIFFKLEVGINLWKNETKVGAECEIWMYVCMSHCGRCRSLSDSSRKALH